MHTEPHLERDRTYCGVGSFCGYLVGLRLGKRGPAYFLNSTELATMICVGEVPWNDGRARIKLSGSVMELMSIVPEIPTWLN
jgi:hypothetical protein